MQHLHNRKTGIKTDEVCQLQRPHGVVRTQFHGRIDRLDATDTFVQGLNRFIDHRQQNAIDDEGGKIF